MLPIFVCISKCDIQNDSGSYLFNQLNIQKYFSAVYSIESTRYNPKPSIYAFRKILRRIGKKAHQCVMVEDDLANLKTAYKIGMKTILVSRQNKKTIFPS